MGLHDKEFREAVRQTPTRPLGDCIPPGCPPKVVIDEDNFATALVEKFVQSQPGKWNRCNFRGLGYADALAWGINEMRRLAALCEQICVVADDLKASADPGVHHKRLNRDAKTAENYSRMWNQNRNEPREIGYLLLKAMRIAVKSVYFLENGYLVVAPSENDSWCAAMVATEIFDAVVSNDADFFIFPGCRRIPCTTFLNADTEAMMRLMPVTSESDVRYHLGMTDENGSKNLIACAVLSGTDRSIPAYIPRDIIGIGSPPENDLSRQFERLLEATRTMADHSLAKKMLIDAYNFYTYTAIRNLLEQAKKIQYPGRRAQDLLSALESRRSTLIETGPEPLEVPDATWRIHVPEEASNLDLYADNFVVCMLGMAKRVRKHIIPSGQAADPANFDYERRDRLSVKFDMTVVHRLENLFHDEENVLDYIKREFTERSEVIKFLFAPAIVTKIAGISNQDIINFFVVLAYNQLTKTDERVQPEFSVHTDVHPFRRLFRLFFRAIGAQDIPEELVSDYERNQNRFLFSLRFRMKSQAKSQVTTGDRMETNSSKPIHQTAEEAVNALRAVTQSSFPAIASVEAIYDRTTNLPVYDDFRRRIQEEIIDQFPITTTESDHRNMPPFHMRGQAIDERSPFQIALFIAGCSIQCLLLYGVWLKRAQNMDLGDVMDSGLTDGEISSILWMVLETVGPTTPTFGIKEGRNLLGTGGSVFERGNRVAVLLRQFASAFDALTDVMCSVSDTLVKLDISLFGTYRDAFEHVATSTQYTLLPCAHHVVNGNELLDFGDQKSSEFNFQNKLTTSECTSKQDAELCWNIYQGLTRNIRELQG